MGERLFDVEDYPEVPIFKEPRRRRSDGDARFVGEYPPEWHRCTTCEGHGKLAQGKPSRVGIEVCPDCLGMGSLKALVRLKAGHRCLRCRHPYMPAKDAKMLGVEASGVGGEHMGGRWSACDTDCLHGGPLRVSFVDGEVREYAKFDNALLLSERPWPDNIERVDAEWRILTVHHADGDKSNVRWWNLLALCQRCHLEIQAKVVMERVYPAPHSEWFRPFVAGFYAWSYLSEELTRDQVEARMDELLGLELDPAFAR